jgi:hypothetical protein
MIATRSRGITTSRRMLSNLGDCRQNHRRRPRVRPSTRLPATSPSNVPKTRLVVVGLRLLSESILWRSKLGGSEKVQLSLPPICPVSPRWFPDAKRLHSYDSCHLHFSVSPDRRCKMQAVCQQPPPDFAQHFQRHESADRLRRTSLDPASVVESTQGFGSRRTFSRPLLRFRPCLLQIFASRRINFKIDAVDMSV